MQVIKPQFIHKPQNQSWYKFTYHKTHKHQKQNFRSISPFGITPLKKHLRLGHAGISLIYQYHIWKKYKKKEWTEAIKNELHPLLKKPSLEHACYKQA